MVKIISRGSGNNLLVRIQLIGAVIFAAVLPFVFRSLSLGDLYIYSSSTLTFVGVLTSILFGTWLFRNIGSFPGVKASAYALPSFSIVFGGMLIIFVLGRLPYDRLLLAAGYGITLAWFYGVQITFPSRVAIIGTLPGSALDITSPAFEIVPLARPDGPLPAVDLVAADLRSDLSDEWENCLARYALAGLPVYHSKYLMESLTGRVELQHLSENNFGSLSPVTAFVQIKHIIDALVAMIAGLFLLPILLLIALAVLLTSSGPALFKQVRIGYRGKPFTVYKFRTMRKENPAGDARSAAITRPADNRVTRFGRFLRTTRLDELPQIINIIRGEMSWIGPRPEAEVLSNWYQQEIPYYAYRHIVRPGITGWAQVCQGHVSTIDEVKEKLNYDFYYIKNFSPWLDILIGAKTLQIMLTGFGSK